MEHSHGYEVYQVYLPKPEAPYRAEWMNPVAWTLMQAEADVVCEYLNDTYDSIYFFITKIHRHV